MHVEVKGGNSEAAREEEEIENRNEIVAGNEPPRKRQGGEEKEAGGGRLQRSKNPDIHSYHYSYSLAFVDDEEMELPRHEKHPISL
eukprot:scaffold735_cov116-Cylindrotheca_fusiformis.AAC.19